MCDIFCPEHVPLATETPVVAPTPLEGSGAGAAAYAGVARMTSSGMLALHTSIISWYCSIK